MYFSTFIVSSLRSDIRSLFRLVPAYQLETAFEVFNRAIQGRDVSTGKTHLRGEPYCTKGPLSTWHIKNEVPPPVESRCYILDPLRTCEEAQIRALRDGRAVIKDFVVVDILDERGILGEQGESIIGICGMQKVLASTKCFIFDLYLSLLNLVLHHNHFD